MFGDFAQTQWLDKLESELSIFSDDTEAPGMGDPNSWREPMILSSSASLEDICLPTSRTKWPRNYCVMIALSTWGSRDTCRQTSVDELLGISAGDSLEILLREERLLATPRAHSCAWILSGILILLVDFLPFYWVFFRPRQQLLRHRKLVDGSSCPKTRCELLTLHREA